MFGPRFARHRAARYRKRGLDRTARRMIDWLVSQGIEDAAVLDIGGGVGELGLALLQRGAGSATTLELTPAYDGPAATLAAEAGLTDRVRRRIGDIATDGTVAEPADVVVLHRVVCCYPDVDRLLGAAADHARRVVVLSHPRRSVLLRLLLGLQNALQRVFGGEYRAYAHPPAAMLSVLRDHGFAAEHLYRGPIWQVIVARRVSTGSSHLYAEAEVPLSAAG